jgi:hypothetical protein
VKPLSVVIVGASSALSDSLVRQLEPHGEILLAGRSGPDLVVDFDSDISDLTIPSRIDTVINLAMVPARNSSENSEARSFTRNILGPSELFTVAERAGVRHFIQISSIFANWNPDDSRYGGHPAHKIDPTIMRVAFHSVSTGGKTGKITTKRDKSPPSEQIGQRTEGNFRTPVQDCAEALPARELVVAEATCHRWPNNHCGLYAEHLKTGPARRQIVTPGA